MVKKTYNELSTARKIHFGIAKFQDDKKAELISLLGNSDVHDSQNLFVYRTFEPESVVVIRYYSYQLKEAHLIGAEENLGRLERDLIEAGETELRKGEKK